MVSNTNATTNTKKPNIYIYKFDNDIDMADDELSDFEPKSTNASTQIQSSNSSYLSSKSKYTNKSTSNFNSSKIVHSTIYQHIHNGNIVKSHVPKLRYSLNNRFFRKVIKISTKSKSNDGINTTLLSLKKTKQTITTPSLVSTKSYSSRLYKLTNNNNNNSNKTIKYNSKKSYTIKYLE